jgi:uncharacterized protein (TIGR03083 family)
MAWLSVERLCAELRGRTSTLAEIVCDDLAHPVPTCPEWTFRQLATHVGRGHRWAAEIVATRATEPIPLREVPDGKFPENPGLRAGWLTASADLVADTVTAAPDAVVWTFIGERPAAFWARRRAHEVAVHLADAQLATGRAADIPPDLAADGISEWFEIITGEAGGNDGLIQARSQGLAGDGETLHFHATDEMPDATADAAVSSPDATAGTPGTAIAGKPDAAGEWLVRCMPSGVSVEHGHGKADVAVRGPAASLLLLLTGRLPASDPAVEVLGDQALLAHWLEHTPF